MYICRQPCTPVFSAVGLLVSLSLGRALRDAMRVAEAALADVHHGAFLAFATLPAVERETNGLAPLLPVEDLIVEVRGRPFVAVPAVLVFVAATAFSFVALILFARWRN